MTLEIVRAQHTEACAEAMEAWIQAWDQDDSADLMLQIHKQRWEAAAKKCPQCFGEKNGHVRPGQELLHGPR